MGTGASGMGIGDGNRGSTRPTRRTPRGLRLAGALAVGACLGLVSTASSCTSRTSGGICDQICECEECPDDYIQNCREDNENLIDVVEKEGCEAEYDAYVRCIDSELICLEGGVVDASACNDELAALTNCAPGGMPPLPGDPCELAYAYLFEKFRMCGIDVGTGGMPIPCQTEEEERVVTCMLPCYEAATCEELQGSDIDGPFFDCILGCLGGGGPYTEPGYP